MPQTPLDLKSDSHLQLAHGLSDMLIDIVRAKPDMGNHVVAEKLTHLRDAIWPLAGGAPAHREQTFREVLSGLDDKQRSQLLESYAHMGHLYEIAGLMARENYFDRLRKEKKPFPGGVREFIAAQPDVETAVGKLAQPVFEVVMTMHPTNVNSLEFMQAQRRLARAIEGGDTAQVRSALERFQATPVLHQVAGHDENLSVRDETRIVLNFLSNIYEDFPRVYKQYDDALKEKQQPYDPLALKLNMRFGSWGSAGDKDGNHNVTAEKTLEAIALHTHAILERYNDNLQYIASPALEDWKVKLKKAQAVLEGDLLPKISALRESSDPAAHTMHADPKRAAEEFDTLSASLASLRATLDAGEFTRALERAYAQGSGEMKDATLDLIRKVRTFGFNFSKIEYRETAKEYGRVVAEIVPGYDKLTPDEKVKTLTALMTEEGNKPAELYRKVRETIMEEGAAKPYSDDNALPIAYHTMKRMELARDHGGIIRDNVLAECGRMPDATSDEQVKMQGLANILEAQFLQRAATSPSGRRPLMGIVPLFEEPDTMQQVDRILKAAYENAAYQQQLSALADDRNSGKKIQQVQIAHSDNVRRSGLQAARAFIHEAHKKIRAVNKEFGIGTQFFEGGSISDAYRNGVRAVSASVNAFGLHDFAKFTFQGGDLLNYFNVPCSNARIFARNLVHPAQRFEKDAAGGWKIGEMAATGRNETIDEVAIAALKRTLPDYQAKDFSAGKMGVMLERLGYFDEIRAGTRGSRAAARKNKPVAFAKVDSTQIGAAEYRPVAVQDIRSISASEVWQHGGIVPSFFGAEKLGEYLYDETIKKVRAIAGAPRNEDEREFLEKFSNVGETLSPAHVRLVYEKSPAFRDAQDQAAFALAKTDPHALDALKQKMASIPDDKLRASGEGYLQRIRGTYKASGKLAHAALRGKALEGEKITVSSVQATMVDTLARLTDDIHRKVAYNAFLGHVRDHAKLGDHDRGVAHNAGDTALHGRFLAADDPAYGQALVEDKLARIKQDFGAGIG